MSRIVLGNRGSALALSAARTVLSELNAEWPDVQVVQRTLRGDERGEDADALLDALAKERVNIALLSLEALPPTLPESLSLAAVTKRLEPRAALLARGKKTLEALDEGAVVGVATVRDGAFLRARRPDVKTQMLSNLDDDLAGLAAGDLHALLVPGSSLIRLERRGLLDTLLEPSVFTPAPGQGSLGLVVREDDFLAADLSYTLQHRPSFDRAAAERAFARPLNEPRLEVGALASVSEEGELNLFGAVVDTESGLVIQAEIGGDASEAEDLGLELSGDVLEQLRGRVS